MGFTQYDLVGMAALLKISPNLETMVLDYLCKFSEDESRPGELLDKPVEFSMPRLKQVTLKVYNDTEAQVDFIEMLIRQEVVLEKLVLVPCKFGEKSYPPMVFNRKDIYRIGSTFSPSLKTVQTPSFRWGIHWLGLIPSF